MSVTSTALIMCVADIDNLAEVKGTPLDGSQYLSSSPLKFKNVSMGCTVAAVSSGRNHTVFLTSDSGVWTYGSGHFGQLGHGNDSFQVCPRVVKGVKTLMPEGYRATGVCAGGNHTVVTCSKINDDFHGGDAESGADVLLAFGFNSKGQCGTGDYTNTVMQPNYVVGFSPPGTKGASRLPPPLPAAEGSTFEGALPPSGRALTVMSVAAGVAHTVVATSRGTVYSFGDGKLGKLGVSVIPPTGVDNGKALSRKKRDKVRERVRR
jgi:alpha-tubulin suppressor-like RCC1 family protein